MRIAYHIIESKSAEIELNQGFKFTIKVPMFRKIDLAIGTFVTNCIICNVTCHFPCAFSDDA